MKHPLRALLVCGAATTLLAGLSAAAPALATATPAPVTRTGPPAVLHVGQIARQNVAPRGNCEPDTLVEPDVAVSPFNSKIQVAVAHDCRFANGGAVDIAYAWTHDGGAHWHNAAVPGLTRAVGGVWARASDPVVAFGPDGSVYISALVFDLTCPGGIAVSRSVNGGATFGKPVIAHVSNTCTFSDDKNWLVVDTSPRSPHRGRLYQFWTPFLGDEAGNAFASPQVLRWSDDRGAHWSRTVNVSATDVFTQDSQPMIQPDGTITDAYLNFGADGGREGPEARETGAETDVQRPDAAAPVGDLMAARTSHDGGATWSPEVTITHDAGEGPAGIRCCLPSATADPRTGRLYAAWDSASPDTVALSTSRDGRHWSAPIRVNREARTGLDHVNADVSAFAGRVVVSYGSRDTTVGTGRYVQQRVSVSRDGGAHFDRPISIGPRSDLRFAAQAGGAFPGDYIGGAAARDRIYLVWCRSSPPRDPAAAFHQTLYAAVLHTAGA